MKGKNAPSVYRGEPVDYREPPDVLFGTPDNLDRVREQVDRLPVVFRIAIEASFYERTSMAELARRLGCHVSVAKRCVQRALNELKYRLENDRTYDKVTALELTFATYAINGYEPRVAGFDGGWRWRGALPILRAFDRTIGHPDHAEPVPWKAGLLASYCESRVLRQHKGLSKFEKGIVEALDG